jgi:DNA-binding NarL/FixJ family response regulator
MIRILCVDDHAVVREGITRVLSRQRDMQVIGAVGTGEEGVAMFERHRPDLTLMDLQLPSMTGLEAIRAIRRIDAQARIMVLTMYEGDEDIRRAIEAGAATYLVKTTLSDDLVRVARDIYCGKEALTDNVLVTLREHPVGDRLTMREVQVMELVAAGQRNKEIAASLAISEDTVEAHMKKIFVKLGVRDRSAALQVAIRRGILHVK